tara:strand:+ start:426 stop:605 length:180 start_codon:yes stop_codon:yes gene_type:complete
MTKEWVKDVPNWEKEYLKMDVSLSLRQKEILNGVDLKSHEGMMYGAMYADWKIKKQLND